MSGWSGKRGRWRKKNGERGRETTFFSQLSSRFIFVFAPSQVLGADNLGAWNRLNLPEQPFKIRGFLGPLWKRQRIYRKHTVDKKTPQHSPSGRLQEVKNNGKLRPSGQKVVEENYRRWSFTRVLTIELSRGENFGVLNRWSLMEGGHLRRERWSHMEVRL